jgi:hypothetical protein
MDLKCIRSIWNTPRQVSRELFQATLAFHEIQVEHVQPDQ